MLKNEIPKWKESKELIEKSVEEKFGLYVELIDDEISVFFLPSDIAESIPEDDRDLFIEWYDFYARIIAREINLYGIFEDISHTKPSSYSLERIKNKLEAQMNAFNHVNKITAKEMLLQTFGFYGK